MTGQRRIELARNAAQLAAAHPGWTKDRIAREMQIEGPRGGREKQVTRLLQLAALPVAIQKMLASAEISAATTEELGAHTGLDDAAKIAVARKIATGVLVRNTGGKQLRALLLWLGRAQRYSYGRDFLNEQAMTFEQALAREAEVEQVRQAAIDAQAEVTYLASARPLSHFGPEVVRAMQDCVDQLYMLAEHTPHLGGDPVHRPHIASQLVTALSLCQQMLSDLHYEEPEPERLIIEHTTS